MDISSKVKDLISSKVEKLGYSIHNVEYVKEDGTYYLRIIIDKNGYIDVEDCINVTKAVDPLLDSVDYIEDSYILDVCSYEKGCDIDAKA